jgi:hypothetical protein
MHVRRLTGETVETVVVTGVVDGTAAARSDRAAGDTARAVCGATCR